MGAAVGTADFLLGGDTAPDPPATDPPAGVVEAVAEPPLASPQTGVAAEDPPARPPLEAAHPLAEPPQYTPLERNTRDRSPARTPIVAPHTAARRRTRPGRRAEHPVRAVHAGHAVCPFRTLQGRRSGRNPRGPRCARRART